MRENAQFVAAAAAAILIVGAVSVAGAVEFRFDASAVDVPPARVWVAGSFNDWDAEQHEMNPSPEGFSYALSLPDGQYEYKFRVVDELDNEYWICDPAHARYAPDNHGGVNSVLTVAGNQAIESSEGFELFECEAPDAPWVNLAGDFNGWNQGVSLKKDADGVWRCWLKVERPITYKFVVGGVWKTDPSEGVEMIDDGLGGVNSHRPATQSHADPSRWTDADVQAALAGVEVRSGKENAQAWEAALKGNYGRAIALTRLMEAGSEPAERQAEGLLVEAAIHRRYGHLERAAGCWEKVCTQLQGTPAYGHAMREWAKHKLLVEKDSAGARALYDQLLAEATEPQVIASLHYDIAFCHEKDERWNDVLTELDQAFAAAPPSDGSDMTYAHLWAEMLGTRGVALWHQGDYAGAKSAFQQVLDVAPFKDSQEAIFARQWIERIDGDAE